MSSTETIYIILFSSGFMVGFGHCLGMCGPILVSLSLSLKGQRVLVPHLLYNVGRVTTYGLLGGIMGVTGSFTRVAASIASLQKGVMIFAGLLIIVMGLAMAGWIPSSAIFGDNYNPIGVLGRGFRKLSQARSVAAYYPLGLLLGLLPCGPVYTALLGAARAGMEAPVVYHGILIGIALMFVFGIGTVPALFLVAKLADMGWLKSRENIYRFGAVLMIGVGIYFIISAIRY